MRRPDRHPVPSFPIWLPVLALACLPAAVLVEVVGKVLEWLGSKGAETDEHEAFWRGFNEGRESHPANARIRELEQQLRAKERKP